MTPAASSTMSRRAAEACSTADSSVPAWYPNARCWTGKRISISRSPNSPAAAPVSTTIAQNTGVRAASPSPAALGCSVAPRPDGSRRLISGGGIRARPTGARVPVVLGLATRHHVISTVGQVLQQKFCHRSISGRRGLGPSVFPRRGGSAAAVRRFGDRSLRDQGDRREGDPMAAEDHRSDPGSAPPAETEPDARYTFANERTFLAWTRTGLAFIVAGLGIVQLLPPFPGVPWGRHLLGVPLIVLGAVIAVVGYYQWTGNQRALRRREPVLRSVLPKILVVSIVGMAVVAAIVVLLSALLRHG